MTIDRDVLLGKRYDHAGHGLCTLVAFDGKGKVRLRYDDGTARWIWLTSAFRAWVRSGVLVESEAA